MAPDAAWSWCSREVIYTLTDPPLKALRRLIPPLRHRRFSLDLSFLVLIVLVQILAYIALDLGRR